MAEVQWLHMGVDFNVEQLQRPPSSWWLKGNRVGPTVFGGKPMEAIKSIGWQIEPFNSRPEYSCALSICSCCIAEKLELRNRWNFLSRSQTNHLWVKKF